METQIVRSEETTMLQRMGTPEDLATLSERFLAFFNIPANDVNNPATKAAGLKAAQLTIRFGFTPGVHVYMVKRGGTWDAEESLEAWKEAANKHSRLEKFLYDVQTRPMSPDEVRANTPPNARYTSEDCGCWARVIRFDIARQYQQLGMQYDPNWVPGFWRKEAYEKKEWSDAKRAYVATGKWESDTIPNQRTPSDVARRRAMRAALKETFSLIQLDDYSVEQRIAAAILHMQREMAPDMPEPNLLPAPDNGKVVYEENGDILFASEPARNSEPVDAQYRVVTQGAPTQPTQAPKANGHTTPMAGAVELAGDPDKARKAFHAQGVQVFGKEWDSARHSLIRNYTTKRTPDNVRESTSELTIGELTELRMGLVNYPDAALQRWEAEKSAQGERMGAALEAAAVAPEVSPEGPF